MSEQFDQKTYDSLYSVVAKFPRKIRERAKSLNDKAIELEQHNMTTSAMRLKQQALSLLRSAQKKLDNSGGGVLGS